MYSSTFCCWLCIAQVQLISHIEKQKKSLSWTLNRIINFFSWAFHMYCIKYEYYSIIEKAINSKMTMSLNNWHIRKMMKWKMHDIMMVELTIAFYDYINIGTGGTNNNNNNNCSIESKFIYSISFTYLILIHLLNKRWK